MLTQTLFDWQYKALQAAGPRDSYGLFSDPGTGKTYCALAIAQAWTEQAIVVSPLSVKKQWVKEAARIGYPLEVFHYEQLRNKKHFAAVANKLVSTGCTLILDESHRIKSPSTATTKAALKLAPMARRRLALTGTPTANSPADLYTQMRFLQPGRKMESFRDFQQEYMVSLPAAHPLRKRIGNNVFVPIRNRDGGVVTRNIHLLKKRVEEYGCTVKLEEVVELPERTFVERICTPSPELRAVYKTLVKNYTAQLRSETITAQNAAVLAGRLARITSGLGHADHEESLPNPKLAQLLEDIDQYVGVGKVIVWSAWIDERKEAQVRLHKAGHSVTDDPNAFMLEHVKVLVASPKMFGTGLNLQCAKYQLWLSRSWSLLEREQALARNYRAGQTEKTVVVDYITEGTIDTRVLTCLENKTDLLKEIMSTGEL
jgi:SNF2 family DNA or RNA helicase